MGKVQCSFLTCAVNVPIHPPGSWKSSPKIKAMPVTRPLSWRQQTVFVPCRTRPHAQIKTWGKSKEMSAPELTGMFLFYGVGTRPEVCITKSGPTGLASRAAFQNCSMASGTRARPAHPLSSVSCVFFFLTNLNWMSLHCIFGWCHPIKILFICLWV